MKKMLLLSFLLAGTAASAQKISFKSKDAKQAAGIHTQFNCSLTELGSADQAATIAAKMKSTPGLLKLDVLNGTGTSADLLIVTDQANNTEILRKALVAAGLNTFQYDGKEYKTAEINNIVVTKNK